MPSLGVGMDMPWGTTPGFRKRAEGDTIDDSLAAFSRENRDYFAHVFLAFQPRDFGRLRAEDYHAAFDSFFAAWGSGKKRALHHTMLNLAGGSAYRRSSLIDFTNRLIEQHGISWVNEDVGIWSLAGKSLPYPLPPILTPGSLQETIRVVREVMKELTVPLVLEFPGFTEGSALILGKMHAFDYFRELAGETGAWVNLDTGHLISYQVLRGNQQTWAADLERLPLDRCFEIHLAGSEIKEDKFRDLHHGILLPEQLSLLKELHRLCPNLEAITYEDPRFLPDGRFHPLTGPSFTALRTLVSNLREGGP